MKFSSDQQNKKFRNAEALFSEKKFTEAAQLLNQLKMDLEASNDFQPLVTINKAILRLKDMNIPPENPNVIDQNIKSQVLPEPMLTTSNKTKLSKDKRSKNDEDYKPTSSIRCSKRK